MSKNPKNIYPFGMVMPERTFSSPVYRYGFNGQEKDDEVAGEGNINTAEYWEYDCRLGRRWNLDPKSNFCSSVYCVFNNNPIFYIDKNGDKFVDPKDESDAKEQKGKFKISENIYTSLASRANKRMKMAYKIHLYNLGDKIARQRDKYSAAANDMKQAQTEIDELTNSDQKFKIERSGGGKSRVENNIFIISINEDEGVFAHELKHAFDFLKKKFIVNENYNGGNSPFKLVDIYDEQAGFIRQFYFRPSSMPESQGGNITEKDKATANASGINASYIQGVIFPTGERPYLKIANFRYDPSGFYSKDSKVYYESLIKPWLMINEPQLFPKYERDEIGKIVPIRK